MSYQMTQVGNQLLKLIDEFLKSNAIPRFVKYEIPAKQYSGGRSGSEIQKNVDYFTIQVSDAIFRNLVREARDLVIIVFAEYLYEKVGVLVPRILIPKCAMLNGSRSFKLRSKLITGPHPFRGDSVSIRIIVCCATQEKATQHLVEMAEAISTTVEPSSNFEVFSKPGDTLTRCLHFLLANGDLQPISERNVTIDTSGLSGFKSGFCLLTTSNNLKLQGLCVHNGELDDARTAGKDYDYLLLEISGCSEQEDKVKAPFLLLRDQAVLAVATGGDEGWFRAKAYLLTAYQQMLLSGDLTLSEADSLFEYFVKAIMRARDKREMIVSLGAGGPKSGLTLARAVKRLSDLDRRTVALNKQLSVAEMEDFIAEAPSVGRDRFSSSRLEPIGDTVECSVFGPPAVPPGESALVQVFLHLPEQAKRASVLARAMDSSTTLKGTRSLEIEIKRGARVEITLAVNELVIDEPVQSAVWQGQPVFCQFLITIPAGTSGRSFFPVVRVSINGSLVGCVKFRISADSSVASPRSSPLGDHVRRYEKAFVSYATKDRKEVLKRVQMLNVLKTNFFLDLLSLDPGDRWEKKLYENIGYCDLFLLFWSQSAKDSLWVIQEVEYALKQQQQNQDGEPDIVPVVLEQNVLPPHSLAALHFNDRIQYLSSLMP